MVRAALLHLAAGVTIGAALLAGDAVGWPGSRPLAAAHRELVTVGWLVQLAMGVGFWVLPPIHGEAIRGRPAWAVAALLNGGVLLFAGAVVAGGAPGAGALLAAGRALEAAAVLLFGVPLAVRAFR
jgi:hypothetical protein